MYNKINLLEVSGISFEVRDWVKIILNFVEEKKPKKKYDTLFHYYGQNYDYNSDYKTPFTHFETHGGDFHGDGWIYGDELIINNQTKRDYPYLESMIDNILFKVELDGLGNFSLEYTTKISKVYDHIISKLISDNLYDNIFYSIDNDELFASNEAGISLFNEQIESDIIEIKGEDYPEAYNNFKVDKWIITNSKRIEYDHNRSGYNNEGKYIVYLNIDFNSINNHSLVHEVKHAYDDWNRISKGRDPIRMGWEIKNIYTPDFEKIILGQNYKINHKLLDIIRNYYLGSKLETPAYLENEYDSKTSYTNYRNTAKKMLNFDYSSYLDENGNPPKDMENSWEILISEYDIPFFRKFKKLNDFLKYTQKYFNKRGADIIKRIDKMRFVHNLPSIKQTSHNKEVKEEIIIKNILKKLL